MLRRLRLDLGLTQRELAQKLGMARLTIIRYEGRKGHIPRVVAIAVRCLAHHNP